MRDVGLDKIFEFTTVCLLKGTKAPNIERLGKVKGVCREAKGDNVVLLAVLFELGRYMTLMAVEDNYLIDPSLLGPCMCIEVLDLL